MRPRKTDVWPKSKKLSPSTFSRALFGFSPPSLVRLEPSCHWDPDASILHTRAKLLGDHSFAGGCFPGAHAVRRGREIRSRRWPRAEQHPAIGLCPHTI